MIATPPTRATRSWRRRRQACSQNPRALTAVGSVPAPSPPPTAISAAPAVAPERIGRSLLVAIWLDNTPIPRACPVTRYAEGTAVEFRGAAETTIQCPPTGFISISRSRLLVTLGSVEPI